jgi:hypothetical protein
MWKRRRRKKVAESTTVVLGLQVAAASEAEREHRAAHPDTVSPLRGVVYGWDAGECSLFELRPARADNAVHAVASEFEAASEETRIGMSAAMTTDDFTTITAFAKRQSAAYLQSKDLDDLAVALSALSMIDAKRIDSRDVAWAAAYIRLVATSSAIGGEAADDLFRVSASRADGETGSILLSFLGRSRQEIERGWLMRVVKRSGSRAIVQSGQGPYAPTMDLLGAATQLSSVFVADGYRAGDPTVGETVGFRWLDQSPGAQAILERSVASVGLGSLFRSGDRSLTQLFLAFIFELPSSHDRQEFERVWRSGKRDFASLIVGHESLLALYIANSAMVGVKSAETDNSLLRFSDPTLAALSDAVGLPFESSSD